MNEFEKALKSVPGDIKIFVDKSFDIADRIHDILSRKGISQRELAQKLGKKESEVSKWLRGNHNFTLKTIAKIESILNEKVV